MTYKSEPMDIAMQFFKNSIIKYDMYGEDTPELAQTLLNAPPKPEGVKYESKESLFREGARNPITDAKSAVDAERYYMSNFFDAQYNTPKAGPSSPEWKAHNEWYNNHPYRQEMNRQWALGLHPRHMSRLNEAGKRDDLMHAGKNPETGRYNKNFDVSRSVEYNRRHPDTPLSNRPSQRFIDWLNNYGIEIDDYLAEQGIGHSEEARKRHTELREKHEIDVPHEERRRKHNEMLAERERKHKLRLERYSKGVEEYRAISDARRRSKLGEKTGWSKDESGAWVYNAEEDETLEKGDAMSKAWFSLLKSGLSFRGDIMEHLPVELNYDNLQQYVQNNPNATMGDLMTPYLTGELTNPTSEIQTNPPSYQGGELPFPLSQEDTTNFVSNFQEDNGYSVPLSYYTPSRTKEDMYNQKLLSNLMRTLHGRIRQVPDAFEISPPRTGHKGQVVDLPKGKMTRHNLRLEQYMNTPVKVRQAQMNPELIQESRQSIPNVMVKMIKKERVSPEAKRHKLEYDKKYESTPERVKYREELNRERRRRGMYGDHSGKDISHTEGGKLTVESEHENRARHFKDKGTLRQIAKGMKEDIELLQNLVSGPMDEQDEKIVNALERKIKEEDEEEEEPYIAHEFFI